MNVKLLIAASSRQQPLYPILGFFPSSLRVNLTTEKALLIPKWYATLTKVAIELKYRGFLVYPLNRMFLASVLGPRAFRYRPLRSSATHNHGSLLPGRRYIHLVHCIYAPSRAGASDQSQLQSLAWYMLRDASQDKVQLVSDKGRRQILPFIKIQEQLEPGQCLEKLEKGLNGEPCYRISHITPNAQGTRIASGEVGTGKSIRFVRAGRGKEMHLNSTLNGEGYRHILRTSMKHINDGCRVEMHVNIGKSERQREHMDLDTVMVENPHLRPDVILRSMPQGTEMVHEPLFHPASYSGGQLIWVMCDERKWSRQSRSTGWNGSSRAPPNQSAMAILKNLPMIRSTSEQADTRKMWRKRS